MKIFESKEEALKSTERFIDIFDHDGRYLNHYQKWGFYGESNQLAKNERTMGMFFLYELELNSPDKTKLYYPKLGIYLNELPCDQTIEIEWVDYRRTYEWGMAYKHNYKNYKGEDSQTEVYLAQVPTEIKRLPIWGDDILVYGVWKSMPNWKQLRQAYERTWWFYRTEDEKRDIQLNRILR